MRHMSIDIETYSNTDIASSGLYKYAQDPAFEIMLIAYSIDFGPVILLDLMNNDSVSQEFCELLKDENVIKHAYNAAFEWYCFNQAGFYTPIEQWQCTMFHGLYCGYTAGLSATGKALGLPEDKQKLVTGKALIKTFCVPCKPSKSNGNRTRTLPHHEPEKWELFKQYCIQDVVTEMAIENKFSNFPVIDEEQKLWQIDILINETGIAIDKALVSGALEIDEAITEELTKEAKLITGLANPNSATQLSKWIEAQTGQEVENMQKDTVSEMLKDIENEKVKRALEIRQELSKTSTKKYVAMAEALCPDGRVRGLLQFYGANRTGRWAGRLVQVQNLPRNYLESLDHARQTVKAKNIDALKIVYGNVPDTLSQLIRTAFIPSQGKLVVADFSAIEARVIAWLAGEQWRQDVFATHGKIYEASASQMFGVPIEHIVKDRPEYALRQKGKVAELALGYQGGAGALVSMGALNMGLSEEELPDIVRRWRESNKRIVDLWYSMENAVLRVMRTGGSVGIKGMIISREVDFVNSLDFLTITLHSGRKLFYPKPFLASNNFDKEALHYNSLNQTTKKWEVTGTYGGKLVENVIQAIARDCLAESIKRVHDLGHKIVMHVHDEIVLDAPTDVKVEDICSIMGEPISWAPELILKAAGFEAEYYMKD